MYGCARVGWVSYRLRVWTCAVWREPVRVRCAPVCAHGVRPMPSAHRFEHPSPDLRVRLSCVLYLAIYGFYARVQLQATL